MSDGILICVPCLIRLQEANNESQRLRYAYMNHLLDQMEVSAGLPGVLPRMQIPERKVITMNTTNNIRVEAGSKVGQINAASINYLDHAVSNFKSGGAIPVASAVQRFTQAVVDSRELNIETQRQILDLLQALVEQIGKPTAERNYSVLNLAVNTIGTLIVAASALGPHWATLKQLIESLIR